jgi:hypothetical protein
MSANRIANIASPKMIEMASMTRMLQAVASMRHAETRRRYTDPVKAGADG